MASEFPLTIRHFPKTFQDFKKLPVKDLTKFISTYSLDGTKILDSVTHKKINLLPNDVDASNTKSLKITSAIKAFNNRSAVDVAVPIFYSKSSALKDHDIYDRLEDYVKDNFNIPKKLFKYILKDNLIHNAIKNKILHGFVIKSKDFVGIDLYVPTGFHFTNSQLTDIVSAYHSGDKKLITKFSSNSILNKLHADGLKFSKYIKPALPLLMKYPKEYRREILRGRLLEVISKYVRI